MSAIKGLQGSSRILPKSLVMTTVKEILLGLYPSSKRQEIETPLRIIHGMSQNIGREGSTYQNVPSA